MIVFKPQDMLMNEKIRLYNNMAQIDDCVGRLEADLRVFPSPRIVWSFETLGENACFPSISNRIEGSAFHMDDSFIYKRQQSGRVSLQSRVAVKGLASRASFGDTNQDFSIFEFLLPNARFQERNFIGQQILEQQVRIRGCEESGPSGTEGRRIVARLSEDWLISLETRQNALTWLDPQNGNVGTLPTTRGVLYQEKDEEEKTIITLSEAEQQIQGFSKLLSFANGGYIGPLYIEGYRYCDEEHRFAATCPVPRVTPLELLGRSWLTLQSDFSSYISCLSILNRMLNSSTWQDAFDLILTWYFQAVQPESSQIRRKPWPVRANAIGAALESLKAVLLIRELGADRTGENEGTDCLLERMGITLDRGFDDLSYVRDFWNIRNAATHRMARISFSDEERDQIIERAIQWIEEILLWRLGYQGEYRDRLSGNSTEPRYDLTTREPSWG